MLTRQEIRSHGRVLNGDLRRLEPFIRMVARRWDSRMHGPRVLRQTCVSRDLWQLALTVSVAGGQPSRNRIAAAVVLLEELLQYPQANRREMRDWALQIHADLVTGRLDADRMFRSDQSDVCLALIEHGVGWPHRVAQEYAALLFKVGYLIAIADGDMTDAERSALHHYIPAPRPWREDPLLDPDAT